MMNQSIPGVSDTGDGSATSGAERIMPSFLAQELYFDQKAIIDQMAILGKKLELPGIPTTIFASEYIESTSFTAKVVARSEDNTRLLRAHSLLSTALGEAIERKNLVRMDEIYSNTGYPISLNDRNLDGRRQIANEFRIICKVLFADIVGLHANHAIEQQGGLNPNLYKFKTQEFLLAQLIFNHYKSIAEQGVSPDSSFGLFKHVIDHTAKHRFTDIPLGENEQENGLLRFGQITYGKMQAILATQKKGYKVYMPTVEEALKQGVAFWAISKGSNDEISQPCKLRLSPQIPPGGLDEVRISRATPQDDAQNNFPKQIDTNGENLIVTASSRWR